MKRKRKFYTNLVLLILKRIGEVGYASIDACFPPQYPEAALWREILGLSKSHTFSRGSFSTTLSRLKDQGLVARRGSKRYSRWSLTKKGEKYAERSIVSYSEPDGKVRIVSFDIPENRRKQREWLRRELVNHDFQCLHKSVWVGRRALSDEFLQDIQDLGLTKYIHIFSINDEGTLKEF